MSPLTSPHTTFPLQPREREPNIGASSSSNQSAAISESSNDTAVRRPLVVPTYSIKISISLKTINGDASTQDSKGTLQISRKIPLLFLGSLTSRVSGHRIFAQLYIVQGQDITFREVTTCNTNACYSYLTFITFLIFNKLNIAIRDSHPDRSIAQNLMLKHHRQPLAIKASTITRHLSASINIQDTSPRQYPR
ncbi:hypothetical protein Cgig2_004062 [Carnegiea gigantea]|uniref:Uncharacterized protein n=1 Tax=Carnegiea gigantea TaxID=171969 RepID=A0A9Q1QNQ8_9CARY|nr:hypothetical protein Cgig2_004062 [Carnegiea gigantea]